MKRIYYVVVVAVLFGITKSFWKEDMTKDHIRITDGNQFPDHAVPDQRYRITFDSGRVIEGITRKNGDAIFSKAKNEIPIEVMFLDGKGRPTSAWYQHYINDKSAPGYEWDSVEFKPWNG